MNYGQTAAIAENTPQILYDKALIDYGHSLGYTTGIASMGPQLGWPSREDWYDGAGPAGFTYGSPNYPLAQEASWGSSILSAF